MSQIVFWEVTDEEGQSFFLQIDNEVAKGFVGPFFAVGPSDLNQVSFHGLLSDILGEGDGNAVLRAVDRQSLADVMLAGFGPVYPSCVMLGTFPVPLSEEGVALAGLLLGGDENPWEDIVKTWGPRMMLAMNTKLLCDVANFDVLH